MCIVEVQSPCVILDLVGVAGGALADQAVTPQFFFSFSQPLFLSDISSIPVYLQCIENPPRNQLFFALAVDISSKLNQEINNFNFYIKKINFYIDFLNFLYYIFNYRRR